ncbi:MAG: LacI family DNA-binding transcriptional regulator [Thermotogae bacterium]|nr:LacI family DNA-binding transcriptional regulator [Thermotogota bacterium]
MKVTIKRIAEILKVNPSTVSRALRGKPGVSEELRNKILRTAEELGYYPDTRARSLKEGSTRTIGILIPDMGNPFFANAVAAMERVLFPMGYSFFLCVTEEDNEKERINLQKLLSYNVDGILAAPVDRIKNIKLYKQIQSKGIPLVFFDRRIVDLKVPYAVTDNRDGVYKLMDYLKKMGHESLGIITLHRESYTGMERLNAAIERAKELGMEVRENWIKDGKSTQRGAYEAAKELFKERKLPTALFVCNNVMTLGVMKALKELSISVPDSISLVTFDDSFWNQIFDPPVTCVAQDPMQLGMIAATMLLNSIKYPDQQEQDGVILKTHFIERYSVKNLLITTNGEG